MLNDMCAITKTIQSDSNNITYCDTLFCFMYGKIISIVPRE